MNRRDFIRNLMNGSLGLAVSTKLDIEKLLWVPGEKTIFLMPELTTTEIVALELERVLPLMKTLFDTPFDYWNLENGRFR